MSQYPPPPPTAYAPGEAYSAGPPPMSKSAVAALVCSLLVCLPGLHGLLGIVFGIIGLTSTSGGRRRGRGMAIAAIPISVILGSISTLMGFGAFMGFRAMIDLATLPPKLQGVFVAASADPAPAIAGLRQISTPAFNRKYSDADLQAWLADIAREYGAARSITMGTQGSPSPTGNLLSLPVSFVNKTTARINLKIDLDEASMSFRISAIDVDGKGPTSSAPSPSADEASEATPESEAP